MRFVAGWDSALLRMLSQASGAHRCWRGSACSPASAAVADHKAGTTCMSHSAPLAPCRLCARRPKRRRGTREWCSQLTRLATRCSQSVCYCSRAAVERTAAYVLHLPLRAEPACAYGSQADALSCCTHSAGRGYRGAASHRPAAHSALCGRVGPGGPAAPAGPQAAAAAGGARASAFLGGRAVLQPSAADSGGEFGWLRPGQTMLRKCV